MRPRRNRQPKLRIIHSSIFRGMGRNRAQEAVGKQLSVDSVLTLLGSNLVVAP